MRFGSAPIRTAVVGVARFGQYQADKYAHHRDVALRAVVDWDLDRGARSMHLSTPSVPRDTRSPAAKTDAVL